MDLRLKHPFTAVVAGPTSCGKSVFVENVIRKTTEVVDTIFSDILWCYSKWHPELIDIDQTVIFQEGLEELTREDFSKPRLIVIDDLMKECNSSVVDLFTRGSHHTNVSVIYITQNLFHQGKGQREISLNAHYLVFFKSPRDSAQISHLARQVFPNEPKFVVESYKDATAIPHGYLLFDLTQSTSDDCRCRTNIFGEQPPGYTIVYQSKANKNKKK
jgi:hypothetical protein